MNFSFRFSLVGACSMLFFSLSQAQDKPANSAEELAKKLANPVSSLISLPFQNNTDYGIGAFKGSRNTMNVQPVIPVSISPKLNLISRVIFPLIAQYNITGAGKSQSGMGDVLATAFLSPSQPKNGLTWGAGPAFLLPLGTDEMLTGKKFGIGPSAVFLKQSNGFTVGGLVNQIWSVSGDASRSDISQLYLQPFLNYNWKSGAGIGGSFEITQNWINSTTQVLFVPSISGVTRLGKQTVSLSAGPRIPITAPDNIRAAFGWRFGVTFVFPK